MRMSRSGWWLCLTSSLLLLGGIASAQEAKKPNILLDEARRTKWLDDWTSDAALQPKTIARHAFLDNQWNRCRIVVQGDRYRSWINDVPCADFRDAADTTGFLGLQVHSIKAGTGPYQVRWRNIFVRELKPGDKVR